MSQQGKYRIIRPLATGGMSELFLARQLLADGHERTVVVKRLHPRLSTEAEQVAMFVGEARILAQLDHPNIVKVYELGKAGDDYFMAMEYARGRSLEDLFNEANKRAKPLTLDLIAHLLDRICDALYHTHGRTDDNGRPLGIVHRDINPHNIQITYRGEVKLLDFGLAKSTTSEEGTKGGRLKGTWAYMSPEQCRGEPLDGRSDIFSAGIVLYELCCRRRLFRRNSEFATVRAILEDPIPPPSSVDRAIPEALDAVILKALQRPPELRFQDAREMGQALKDAASRHGWYAGTEQTAEVMYDLFPSGHMPTTEQEDLGFEGQGPTPVPEVEADFAEEEVSAGQVLELEALVPGDEAWAVLPSGAAGKSEPGSSSDDLDFGSGPVAASGHGLVTGAEAHEGVDPSAGAPDAEGVNLRFAPVRDDTDDSATDASPASGPATGRARSTGPGPSPSRTGSGAAVRVAEPALTTLRIDGARFVPRPRRRIFVILIAALIMLISAAAVYLLLDRLQLFSEAEPPPAYRLRAGQAHDLIRASRFSEEQGPRIVQEARPG